MGTDIYGAIEVRHPCADQDWWEWPAWQRLMDLSPLYDDRDYSAFAVLFGVRNSAGYSPVAAGRGLPADVSAELREEFERVQGIDSAVHGATWVSCAELDRADLTGIDALGPGSGWEHVFAVLRALAGRFGGDGVRLVVYFD
ncbi:hypothetical protein E6W39_01890 [Kitasatospora acidiphila]|uniref:DUF1877 family protein n=1 Tax=Kitasatospora acidiphila TaxID=2567942 RepID=A0A540VWX8_9ACTN|nr:hypothetical protein [Kitasatospora acidiphila]TQF01217.1 hypothetical protein E6W39_01890 [Kitasatospora acidiphila]